MKREDLLKKNMYDWLDESFIFNPLYLTNYQEP